MYFVIYVNRYSVLGVYILRCVFRGRLDNKYMCVEIRSPLHFTGVKSPPKFKFHIRNIIVCIRNIIVRIRNIIVHIRNIIVHIRSIIVRIRNIILCIRNINIRFSF